MKNKLLISFALFLVWFQFYSCSTDYDGPEPKNQTPVVNFYETTDVTSSKKTKIQWYGNDVDGIKTTYYYVVTVEDDVSKNVRSKIEKMIFFKNYNQ